MNLPNTLTVLRFFSVPLFLYLLHTEHWLTATILYAIATFTDLIDGYIARKFNLITKFGTIFDPLVDKVLVTTGLVILVQLGAVPGWAVIVMIIREFLVTGLRSSLAEEGKILSAELIGKYKAFYQNLSIGGILLGISTAAYSIKASTFFWCGGLLFFWLALVLSIISGLLYLWASRSILYEEKAVSPSLVKSMPMKRKLRSESNF